MWKWTKHKTCMQRTIKCQWKVKTLKNWRARLEDSEMLRILLNLIFSFDIIPIKIQAGICPLEIFQMLLERERVTATAIWNAKTLLGPPGVPSRQPLQPVVSLEWSSVSTHRLADRFDEGAKAIDWMKNLGARWAKHVITEVVTQTLFVNTTLTRVDLTV